MLFSKPITFCLSGARDCVHSRMCVTSLLVKDDARGAREFVTKVNLDIYACSWWEPMLRRACVLSNQGCQIKGRSQHRMGLPWTTKTKFKTPVCDQPETLYGIRSRQHPCHQHAQDISLWLASLLSLLSLPSPSLGHGAHHARSRDALGLHHPCMFSPRLAA